MTQRCRWLAPLVGACVVVTPMTSTPAQTIIDGPTAADNAGPGPVALRAPGRMVTAGLARALERAATFRARPQITETSRPPSIPAQALPVAIDTFFGELNQFLFFIFNRLLAREGLPSLSPIDFLPPELPPTDGVDDGDGESSDLLDQTGTGEQPEDTVSEPNDDVEMPDSTDRGGDRDPRGRGNS